jgi:hypothetical protein
LDPIEKAIRNAFAKGNAEDRAFREKVYRSAFAALDRALQANPSITVETAIKRRKAMQARIAEIEAEFLPSAAPQVERDAPTPSVEAPAVTAPAAASAPSPAPGNGRQEPSMGAEPAPAVAASSRSDAAPVVPDIVLEPTFAGSTSTEAGSFAGGGVEVMPDRDERRAARRFPVRRFVFGLLVLAAIAAGVWWVATSGVLKLPQRPGASAVGSSESPGNNVAEPVRPGDADQDRNWIVVFTPDDPTLVSAPSDASAEVTKDDTGSFLRIRSGASGAAVSFDVGQGVLKELAGKHAVFDVLARSEEGKPTQMVLDCNFGDFGDCGRRRFAVGHERNEYLFDVQFPDAQPKAGGTIAINPDFEAQGKAIDIYEIRVSVAQ